MAWRWRPSWRLVLSWWFWEQSMQGDLCDFCAKPLNVAWRDCEHLRRMWAFARVGPKKALWWTWKWSDCSDSSVRAISVWWWGERNCNAKRPWAHSSLGRKTQSGFSSAVGSLPRRMSPRSGSASASSSTLINAFNGTLGLVLGLSDLLLRAPMVKALRLREARRSRSKTIRSCESMEPFSARAQMSGFIIHGFIQNLPWQKVKWLCDALSLIQAQIEKCLGVGLSNRGSLMEHVRHSLNYRHSCQAEAKGSLTFQEVFFTTMLRAMGQHKRSKRTTWNSIDWFWNQIWPIFPS